MACHGKYLLSQKEPLEKVGLDRLIPLDNEVYDFIRDDEVTIPLTMSAIRKKYEQKHNTYLCVHYESGKGYFYAERNTKGHLKKHYYPTFNKAMRGLIISGVGLHNK